MRTFSKSKIIAFRQCPKRLWLEVHRPELREDSAETQARFQTGYQVGDMARRIYDPEGKGTLIDFKTEGFDGAYARTAELLANSRQPVFEAGFKMEGAMAFADVLLPEQARGQPVWRMIEIKSTTSVKDYHRDDIAVQTFVAQAAGVPLNSHLSPAMAPIPERQLPQPILSETKPSPFFRTSSCYRAQCRERRVHPQRGNASAS